MLSFLDANGDGKIDPPEIAHWFRSAVTWGLIAWAYLHGVVPGVVPEAPCAPAPAVAPAASPSGEVQGHPDTDVKPAAG